MAYHGQEQKNLIKYRETIEKSIQKDPNTPLTTEEIKASSLEPGQKSFLLIWNNRKNDTGLLGIQEDQQRFVEHAREHFREKTLQQKVTEVVQDPMKAAPMLLAAGFVGACLYGAYKLLKK